MAISEIDVWKRLVNSPVARAGLAFFTVVVAQGSCLNSGGGGNTDTRTSTQAPITQPQPLNAAERINRQLSGDLPGCPSLQEVQGTGHGTDAKGCASNKCCGYPPNKGATND